MADANMEQVVMLPLSRVWSKEQHRTDFPEDEIAALAGSIKSIGLMYPIEVEPGEKHGGKPGTYCITDGECRYRASVLAGLDTIRAFVVENASEADRLARQAAANLARVPLSPMAKARAVGYHFDKLRREKPYLSEEDATRKAAEACGVSPQFAFGKLGLLRLPGGVQAMLDKDHPDIGERAALVLLRLVERGDEAGAVDIARRARAHSLTVKQVSDEVLARIGEQSQGDLFGGADVGRESAEVRETRTVLARLVALYERAQAVAFDERKQEFRFGDMRAEDLAQVEAKLAGAANMLRTVLAGVRAAQGKPSESVVEAAQAAPEVEVAQEAEDAVPTRQDERERPLRQAVLVEPERVEFGGEVRVATVGSWLWVFGVGEPGRSSLAWAIERAGARWARGRKAWYSPHEEEQARIQEVIREYLSQAQESQEQAAIQAAG